MPKSLYVCIQCTLYILAALCTDVPKLHTNTQYTVGWRNLALFEIEQIAADYLYLFMFNSKTSVNFAMRERYTDVVQGIKVVPSSCVNELGMLQ